MQSLIIPLVFDNPGGLPAAVAAGALDDTVLTAAFSAARMGVWECGLPDEALRWTAGVYDLFDLPQHVVPDRAYTLSLYSPKSRAELTARRSRAIAECSGFEMDAEIVTPLGNRRWIRITATVEHCDGTPRRIFGIKHDITQERSRFERIRYLSEHDPLTGLANRAAFQSALEQAVQEEQNVALMLIDLDGFKLMNDRNGHSAGDAVLRDAGRIIAAACAPSDLAARIGGDEFALLLTAEPDVPARTAGRLLAGLPIGASIGIALLRNHPDADAVFQAADAALYAAKAAGRGRWVEAL